MPVSGVRRHLSAGAKTILLAAEQTFLRYVLQILSQLRHRIVLFYAYRSLHGCLLISA